MPAHDPSPGIPRRFMAYACSAVIIFHLSAVMVGAMAAPSGPWPTMEGALLASPPQFAFTLHRDLFSAYLRPVNMNSSYHFNSNRPGHPGCKLVAKLKNEDGEIIEEIQLPDPKANSWVRHRQAILVSWLVPDEPLPQLPGEVIAAPGKEPPKVSVWEMPDQSKQHEVHLRTMPQHLVPRNQPFFRPSEQSMILIRSYARHLCRTHDAAKVEMVRYSRETIPPAVLSRDQQQPQQPGNQPDEPLVATYGEFTK